MKILPNTFFSFLSQSENVILRLPAKLTNLILNVKISDEIKYYLENSNDWTSQFQLTSELAGTI
jgi:hypothetical protein